MGRKAEREGVPLDAGALLHMRGTSRSDEPHAPASEQERWFEAGDPEPPPPRRDARRLWVLPLLAVGLIAVALTRSLTWRMLLPAALAGAALLLFRRGRQAREAEAAPAQPRRRGISLTSMRLELHGGRSGAPLLLLDMAQPFGVTLLASPRRERMVALLSSSAGTFYVGAAFDAAARRSFAGLTTRATIVAADEVGLEAIGPDGEPLTLSPAALSALVEELTQRAPGCLDRFFLTDARGAALTLDGQGGRELRAGGRTFDLGAPIEWRAFVFQEAIGQAVALYQATWVRQGTSEIVLVCLLPAISPAPEGEGVPLSSLDRSALRDLRLMQGTPEDPPQAEQRVAVDRLLMLPIRSALDKAPRAAAQPPRARA